MSDDPGQVIDLAPRLRRKRQDSCRHEEFSVDDVLPDVTCDLCGAQIDPWFVLRTMAHRWDEMEARVKREVAEAVAKGTAAIEQMNRQIERLNVELAELTERKNRLWNEQIAGRPLGSYRKVRARKATR